jgi:predicted AAA+ superfamily ATPase
VAGYRERLVDAVLEDDLAGLPAVMVVGPRACGKTTTARRHAVQVVHLDRPSEAFAFQSDADDALTRVREPVLIDEWQEVPAVLGAVKRALDEGAFTPNRFILTGSALPLSGQHGWLGTGRVVDLRMDPLTRREIGGRVGGSLFLDRLRVGGDFDPAEPARLSDYLAWALRGGFPEVALDVPASHARRWLDGYIDRLVTHDVRALAGQRDSDALRRYLAALAANTAGVVQNKTLYEVADIAATTARAYDQLLRNMFVLDTVPAWSTNRLSRLIDTPKRFLVDPGLAGALLGLSLDGLLRDGDMVGRVLETFVLSQLRPEAQVCADRPRLHHFRDKDGRHEVDLIVDYGSQVAAVEVKAGAAPSVRDFRHLRWLRDSLGDRFSCGVLLHTGPAPARVDDRIFAAPISTIWF